VDSGNWKMSCNSSIFLAGSTKIFLLIVNEYSSGRVVSISYFAIQHVTPNIDC
jgi:hypothetical protein